MNRLLALGGILAVLGGFVLLVIPGPPVPLLDANRQLLAESEQEGYCAGQTFWNTNGGGDEALMAECLSDSPLDDETDLHAVQPAFCRAVVVEGYQGTEENCMSILGGNKLWPTLVGGLTESWNRRFPYPLDSLTTGGQVQPSSDRTGDREETDREEGLR